MSIDEDELAAARAARNAPLDEDGEEKTLEQLEAEGVSPVEEEDDGQFSLNAGQRATRGTLIPRGTSVEFAIVFGKRRLQGRDVGLVRFGESVLWLTRGLAGPTRDVPHYSDEDLTDVVTEQTLMPKRIVNADSAEAMEMLAGILEKRGWVCTRAEAA